MPTGKRKDVERIRRIHSALSRSNWDMLVCAMPSNVLLTTGYWPGVGFSLSVFTRDGAVGLVVPDDEAELAEESWADFIEPYAGSPLDRLATVDEPILAALQRLQPKLDCSTGRIAFEQTDAFEPAAYSPNLLRANSARLLRRAYPHSILAPADELLIELREVKTQLEIDQIRNACRMVEGAFRSGKASLRAGVSEAEAAAAIRFSLGACLGSIDGVRRCDGFVFCISGANGGGGYGPYPRSSARRIEPGDSVIVRCQAYSDGYWVDVVRTYQIEPASVEHTHFFKSLLQARDEAIRAIIPGARAAEVDSAARKSLAAAGLESAFKHSAGHGVGFGAMDHLARPRLHPHSTDVLTPGMVLKVETGIYMEGRAGFRNAEIVLVGNVGPEVLTRFHFRPDDLTLSRPEHA